MRRRKRKVWTDEIRAYIISCYKGVARNRFGRRVRVFGWKHGKTETAGGTEDFILHLEERFNMDLAPTAWGSIHTILRDAGHQVFEAPHPSPTPSPRGKIRPSVRLEEKEPDPRRVAMLKLRDALVETAAAVEAIALAFTEGD